MIHSIAKFAGLAALLCPSVLSAAVPAERSPLDVPWKRHGLVSKRGDNSLHQRTYDTGCQNGPGSRHCWSGDYNLDTDMDEKWPNTGKTVTVGCCHQFDARVLMSCSTILRLQTQPYHQMVYPE
jgi:hypothetical protein